MNEELTLVPAARLGALLSTQRRRYNETLASLAANSGGTFSVHDLEQAERGRYKLSTERIQSLISLYELGATEVVPRRTHLVIDFDNNTMASGDNSAKLGPPDTKEILKRYLAFVYVMRQQQPGTPISLRSNDLAVLSQALQLSTDTVYDQLTALMSDADVATKSASIKKGFAVAGAGLLVAITSLGSLVFVSGDSSDRLATPAPTTEQSSTPQLSQTLQSEAQTNVAHVGYNKKQTNQKQVSDTVEASTTIEEQEKTSTTEKKQVEKTVTTASKEHQTETTKETTKATTELKANKHNHEPIKQAFADNDPTDSVKPVEAIAATQETTGETEAAATQTQSASLTYEAIGQQAESMIAYDWQSKLPGWTVRYEGDRPGYRGITVLSEKSVTIYINPGDTATDVAGILAHELGHALDVTYLQNQDRVQWLEARGMPAVWWAGEGLNDFSVGAGDFAEAVAALWVGSPSDSVHGNFTPAQLQLTAELLPR